MRSFAAAAFACVIATAAASQDYPSRAIKLMQGFPPGGNIDIIARILAHDMQESFGQPVVVEGKPGASGTLAAEMVARSDPDGYTLLVVSSVHPMFGALSKNVRYRVVEDFSWISVVSSYPLLICVRNDSRFSTLKELIDAAHATPGSLKYASAGTGTGLHTIVELIANATQSKFLHVPYRGESGAITALIAGEVDFVATTVGSVAPRIDAGEFRALAATTKTRWPDLPQVPTVDEAGVPGFDYLAWTGLAGPALLPASIVNRLNAEVRRAIAVPETKRRLQATGADPLAVSPDEMQALVARQYETWKRLGESAHLAID